MGKGYCIKLDMQLCQGHGECAEEAPDVFEVNYDTPAYPKVRVKQSHPGPELRSQVEAAARYCPNRVITVVDVADD